MGTMYALIGANGTNLARRDRSDKNGSLTDYYLGKDGKWVEANMSSYWYDNIDTEPISRERAVVEAVRLYPGFEVDLP